MAITNLLSGATGILMAVPQLGGLLSNSVANTIGYQPQNNDPLNPRPALIFHYEGEQTAALESDITDHYVEDNTAVQDQIALRPEIITTHGFIGELTDAPPNTVLAALQLVSNKLTIIPGLTPQLSATALLAYNNAIFAYNTALNLANSAVSAFSSIAGGVSGEAVIDQTGISNTTEPNIFGIQTQSKQQVYFQQFYGYWKTRTLFTVQTPWAVFRNMAIKSLRAIQDEKTNVITDFEVSFKMIRYASSNNGLATGLTATDAGEGTRLQQQSFPGISLPNTNLSPSATAFPFSAVA